MQNQNLLKIEEDILNVMKKLNASKEASSKSIKEIAVKSNRSKNLILNVTDRLVKKKLIGKTIVNKSIHYFLLN